MYWSHLGQFIEKIKILTCIPKRDAPHGGISLAAERAAAAESMKCIGRATALQLQYIVMKFQLIDHRSSDDCRITDRAMGKR